MVKHYVYYLRNGNTAATVYVGRSINPIGRWRTHQKRMGYALAISAVVCCSSLEEAMALEISAIDTLQPALNKTRESSRARLGMKNRPEHTAAMMAGLRAKGYTKEAGARRWERRSRAPEDNSFFGHQHTNATKDKLRAANKAQFSDEEKRKRHRDACIASVEKRKALGLPMGRHARKTR